MGQEDTIEEMMSPHPLERSRWNPRALFSRVFFTWMIPVFFLARKQTLCEDDFYPLPSYDASTALTDRLEALFEYHAKVSFFLNVPSHLSEVPTLESPGNRMVVLRSCQAAPAHQHVSDAGGDHKFRLAGVFLKRGTSFL